jgi:hypothetical protein
MATKHSREAAGTVFSCMGAYGMLWSMLPNMVQGYLGAVLLLGALLMALLTIAVDLRHRGRLLYSIIGVLFVAGFGFAVGAGPYMFLTWYMADKPLFSLGQ